ncbi:cytidylate kinase family protein [Candidatus Daviesbacteria bacterium]|nr:cytidylate kinase family protein [Candidatus Daviesbacteria bacterium]
MKFRSIAISGDIGTGKTTLAKKLAEKLGWNHVNAGDYFRKWHEENNVPLNETEKIPEEKDKELDYEFQNQMRTEENTVFESRLAGWLAKDMADVLKVLCVADFKTAAKRASERDQVSLEEGTENARIRSRALKEKFKKLYKVDDYLDPKYFDLVVDTVKNDPEQALNLALKALEKE